MERESRVECGIGSCVCLGTFPRTRRRRVSARHGRHPRMISLSFSLGNPRAADPRASSSSRDLSPVRRGRARRDMRRENQYGSPAERPVCAAPWNNVNLSVGRRNVVALVVR